MRHTNVRVVTAVIGMLLAAVACGTPAARSAAPSPVGRGASPIPAASRSPASTGPAVPSPTASPAAATFAGNFDGGGAGESVAVDFADGAWWIAFDLGSSTPRAPLASFFQECSAVPNVPLSLRPDSPHVIGVGDLRSDGIDETVVQIYRGASTGFPAIFGIVNGSIEAATVADGANTCQRIFPIQGSVTHGNGFACAPVAGAGGLQVLQADSRPPSYGVFDWFRSDYEWQGLNLHLVEVEHQVFELSNQQLNGGSPWPPLLSAAWQSRCAGLPANPE